MNYSFSYKGRGASWNDIYGSNDWRKRKSIVDKYKKIFQWLLKEAKIPYLYEFEIVVHYSSRHDVDNIGCMVKLCADAMKGFYCHDDSPKYFKRMEIIHDPSLEHNEFKFTIIQLK